jgi:FdhD protein
MQPNEFHVKHSTKKTQGRTIGFAAQMRAAPTPFEIAVEKAYAVHINGQSYAVMMLTPSDLADFARGFCLTEGIITDPADIRTISVRDDDHAIIDVQLHPDKFKQHLARQRALSGRTSCGLCGLTDLHTLTRAQPIGKSDHTLPSAEALHQALLHLDAHQPINARTHAVHAAALCDHQGHILCVREDVGRHNALDKLIGAITTIPAHERGFVLITSRCSFEMVEKAASAGVSTLVAISAPTSLALERATHIGMNLIAVARTDSAIVFHHHIENEKALM